MANAMGGVLSVLDFPCRSVRVGYIQVGDVVWVAGRWTAVTVNKRYPDGFRAICVVDWDPVTYDDDAFHMLLVRIETGPLESLLGCEIQVGDYVRMHPGKFGRWWRVENTDIRGPADRFARFSDPAFNPDTLENAGKIFTTIDDDTRYDVRRRTLKTKACRAM